MLFEELSLILPLSHVRSVMDASRPLVCFILIFVLSGTINGENSAPSIKRKQSETMPSFANFKKYPFHSLLGDILESIPEVRKFSECAYSCLTTDRCISFNIQAEPDHNRRYHCDLLETDLFSSPHKFQGNGSFHHYALKAGVS